MSKMMLSDPLCPVAGATPCADVSVSGMFGDHKVLHHGKPTVWREAAPREMPTLSFAGAEVTTEADEQGTRRAELPLFKASAKSRTMTDALKRCLRVNSI